MNSLSPVEEGWNKTVATAFINRYDFPNGELDCVSNIQLGMERAGFEIHDIEDLRPHCALTLRHWVRRLETRRDEALREVDEPTYRAGGSTWRPVRSSSNLSAPAFTTFSLPNATGAHGLFRRGGATSTTHRWPARTR